MIKMKCPDCGLEFDGSMKECPNCGCPASSCEQLPEAIANHSNTTQDLDPSPTVTTDTGYAAEKTIKLYGDLVFWICVGICAIVAFIIVSLSIYYSKSFFEYGGLSSVLFIIYAFLIIAVVLFIAFVFRSFVRVLHNISVNLHEINMKIK